MQDLVSFLDRLAADPQLRTDFAAAPAAILTREGVDTSRLEIPERMDLSALEDRLRELARVRDRVPSEPASTLRPPQPPQAHTPVWSGERAQSPGRAESGAAGRRLTRGQPLPGLRCPGRLQRRLAGAESGPASRMLTAVPEAAAADERAPLPGAWFATHGTAISRMLSNQSHGQPMVAEAIFGKDDREQVTDTSALPYHWLCALVITAGNGTRWFGTGWLAGPRVVVTAGHCVFMPTQGGWVREVMVLPGRNGVIAAPRISSSQLHSVEGWVVQGLPEHDYGAIILPNDALAPDWGYFGYGAIDDRELLESMVNIAGYPIDKEQGTVWAQVNNLLSVSSSLLVYENDTFGGMSGCPVVRWDGSDYLAVGIHNYGDLTGNRATRISKQVFDNINFWKTF